MLDDEYEARVEHHRRVTRELEALRARDDARRLFDLERHPAADYAGLYLDADQLDQLPAADPLIDKVLNRHSYVVLNGRDGTFKSFVALDWSFCLATGKPWQGRTVEPTRVLYIVGEGAYGIDKRKRSWEAAWKHKVPAAMFTARTAPLDMHVGGPAFDELLDRVSSGAYGLVVVDTLRRVSGSAKENTSEMGAVVDNLKRLQESTDGGSVLVLAHTAKDDIDSRGYSGIEDDADTVWHARRPKDGPPMALDLTNKKMKDGPDSERIELTMSPVLDSLIVSKYARAGGGLIVESYDTDDAVMDAMRTTFALTGASVTQLLEVTEMPKSTVYKARGRLLASGQIITRRKGGTAYLYLPGTPVESPWNPGADSTPIPHPHPEPVHTEPEHESTGFHGIPHPESTPVHTPPPVLETGVAWTDPVNTCPRHPEKPKHSACDTCDQITQESS